MRRALLFGVIGLAAAGCGGAVDADARGSDGGVTNDDALAPGLNDRCVNALALDLTTGAHVVIGDTGVGSDEHAKLDCDSVHVAGEGLNAAQLYYLVPVEAQAVYRMTLRPTFYGFVYVFDAALGCGFESTQLACSSDGASGDISPIVNPTTKATFDFQLGFSGEAVLAVDSDTSAGPFELEIQRL